MANFRIPTATQNALVNQVTTLIDAGVAGGTINFYTDPQPASANTSITSQTLLATLTFATTSFATAVSGTITANGITGADAVASGTATWARIKDSTGTSVFDCDVALSGATINLNAISLVSGGPVAISSFTITMPAGA